MARWSVNLALAALTACALGGCAGSDPEPEAASASASSDPPVTTSSPPTASAAPKSSPRADRSATATTAPAGGGPASTFPVEPLADASSGKPMTPLQATLAKPCVTIGDSQSITIRSPAESVAGYDSRYPDGKTGMDRDTFYGGNNGMNMPASGEWTDTWTITSAAPPGKVTVTVLALARDHEPAQMELFFDLVRPTDGCP